MGGAAPVNQTTIANINRELETDPINVDVSGTTFQSRGTSGSTGSATDSDDSLSGGEVAGIVIAVLVIVLVIAAFAIIKMRQERNQAKPSTASKQESNRDFSHTTIRTQRASLTSL